MSANLKAVSNSAYMENTSGRHPQGRAVLVIAYEPETVKAILDSSLIIPDHVRQSMAVLENRARVIELGAWVWNDEPRPRAKVGDIVLITRMAGFITKGKDGKLYRLVNDRDIFCTCDEDEGG